MAVRKRATKSRAGVPGVAGRQAARSSEPSRKVPSARDAYPVPGNEGQPGLFNPIRPRRAFDEISAEIKRLIFEGVLKPGDRLPSETELASQFGVGRQTIREALRLLELSGFISMQKGGAGGPLIVDTILSSITGSFVDAFQMGRISHDELTIARMEVEKIVLRYFLANARPEDIDALRENVGRARQKIAGRREIFDENLGFHRILARASGNQVFVIALESILAVVAHFRSLFTMGLQGPRKVLEEHERILEAIEKGRQDEALALMEKHLVSVDQRFRDLVKRSGSSRRHEGGAAGPSRRAR